MSREIKFRFWHDQQMHHWSDFACLDMCDWLNKDDVVAMQYTGLKDKNGVEIYEGDILINRDHARRKTPLIKVEYVGPFAGFHPLFQTEQPYNIGTCEVIGNIYENPELINAA